MKNLIWVFAIILCFNIIGNASANLILTPADTEAIKFNENHIFTLNVYNETTGQEITTAVCTLTLKNSTGNLMYVGNYSYSSPHYFLTVKASNFSQDDLLDYNIYCSLSGQGGEDKGEIIINTNGKGEPSGVVIVSFMLIFMLIFIFGIVYFLRLIELLASLDVHLTDVGLMWGVYFGLLTLFRLETIYLGNIEFYSWLELFIKLTSWPFIWIPIVAFLISFITALVRKKKVKDAY